MARPLGLEGRGVVGAGSAPSLDLPLDGGTDKGVERALAQRLPQKRNRKLAVRLKRLYGWTCMAYAQRGLIGVKPDQLHVEAAHVIPLGILHNGPDKAGNLVVLCPNCHTRFDRGVLSFNAAGTAWVCRDLGTGLNGKPLAAKHKLDPACLAWHAANFAGVGK